MSASNWFENALQKLIFNNENIPGIGDTTGVRGSQAAGKLYVALHTADPEEAGDQTSNEVSYTGYERIGLDRSSSAFTVTDNQTKNASNVEFGVNGSESPVTITHFSIGVNASGASNIVMRGQLTVPFVCSPGIAPKFFAEQLQTTVD